MSYQILFDKENIDIKIFKKISSTEQIFLDLFKKIYKRDYKIDVFKWYELLYGENIWALAIEKDSEQFVGMFGLMTIKTFLKGKEYKSYLAHNAGVIDKYRGQGLFQYIGEVILKKTLGNYEFAIGFPNIYAIKGHLQVGWCSIGNMIFFKKLNNKYREFNKNEFKYVYEVNKFPKEIDKFTFEYCKKHEILLNKDYNFLNWRIKRPNQKYNCFIYKKNGIIRGYMIYKRYYDKENDLIKSHIIDIQANNEKIFKILIRKAEELSNTINTDLLNIWVFEKCNLQKIMQKEDFIIDEESFYTPVILYTKNKTLNNIIYKLDKKNLMLSLADNDVF